MMIGSMGRNAHRLNVVLNESKYQNGGLLVTNMEERSSKMTIRGSHFWRVHSIGTSGQTQESDVSEGDPGPQNKMHAYVTHDTLVSKDESKEDWIVVENRRRQRNAGGERNRSHTVSRI